MNHHIYFHILWSTRDHRRLITRDGARFLDRTLRTIAEQERTRVLALGIVTTHVHLLVRAHPMTAVPRLLQRLKGASSALAGRALRQTPGRQLQWAPGYTIHTVSPSVVAKLADYVRNQAVRHPREAIKGWKGSMGDPREERSPPGQFEDELGCLEKVKRLRPR
jgi:putative transposase